MSIDELKFVPLSADMEIKPFSCTDDDLNDFLFDDARNYLKELLATTYLFENPFNDSTVAYFSLLNDRLSSDPDGRTEWNRLNRAIHNSKRRKQYPAVKIGRLAVSQEYTGMGIGKAILHIIKFIATHKCPMGCRFLTVDAYQDAVGFYKNAKFEFITERDKDEDTRLMYYDLKQFLTETK
ncbi:MAG: GNAT family N-acetyltransferase [Prevotella sp.]|nr:GNAT family N-acetyltransferase [Prevotella sp.]